MRIRVLAASAVLAAALATTTIPAIANEPSSTPVPAATADDLGWGVIGPGSSPSPTPTPTDLPTGDLGWG
ncbi:hypothetical protein OOK13_40170 [Streptomyces sp. NBC_00378]|uniref:hypothetical protein n=1 Tax=unclassified Streptomyces TaxID=2593676 RepID=UPI00224CB89F|nr:MULTISPECIES: hypothetical protein [unclassified Streptomyces]MCX5114578.1 hypothetical protein [Streptomyces sp. NBC_00378]